MNTEVLIILFFGVIMTSLAVYAATRGKAAPEDKPAESPSPDTKTPTAQDLGAIAEKLESRLENLAHPGDCLQDEDFEKAAAALASDAYTIVQVRNYAMGSNWVLQCIGLEALRRREDSAAILDRTRSRLKNLWAWPLYFAIRFLDEKSDEPEIGNMLTGAQYWWADNAMLCEELGTLFEKRLQAGEEVILGKSFSAADDETRGNIDKFVAALQDGVRQPIQAAIKARSKDSIDRNFLRSSGEILSRQQLRDPVFVTKQISRLKEELIAEFAGGRPKSILVVGDSGVGKSALRRLLANELLDAGWHVFKTSATNIIADKVYVGQIEGQVQKLARNASVAKRVAIYVDRLNELDEFGRHSRKDTSILDQLWPMIENQEMFFVSETTPSGLQAMLKRYPSLPTSLKIVKMEPATEAATAEMAGSLLDLVDVELSDSRKDEVVAEALQLSQQYLSHKSLPGSVLTLVELSVVRSQRSDADEPLNRVHVLGALSQISGLPKDVLDERQKLDVDAVRQAFTKRIIGQDEAVECLVERIAMLKAGLTDPSRPVGVFLFAGPTGTGKTEIAKTLAELLFGSPEQMIRLDMSEYQNADSAWRLIGEQDDRGGKGSLATRIREQPFSVVLLDEFEKAHVNVWDMFLQVFDDGRLTDSKGGLADFRHSIIILTSNLGSTISNEAGIGFTSRTGEFSPDDVMKTVNRTFRREFVNRLDRVVVFKPLGRDVMRAILRKELRLALERRGFRSKQWAVEWEDSAVEFLLNEGFTPDLGARPLRRAIERHLLAPLSMTMVQNEAPAGEQFLFIRSNGQQLQVEFIDPDADAPFDTVPGAGDTSPSVSLEQILRASAPTKDAAALLLSEFAAIQSRVAANDWQQHKSDLLTEMNSSEFWEQEKRFATLDRVELIDRIDTAVSVLGRLVERLDASSANSKLVRSIANRIFVVREGLKDFDDNRSTQAIIGVRLVTSDKTMEGAAAFRDQLIRMYREWARERGMRLQELDARDSRYEALFLVSGFGSFGLLQAESGLHVFEIPAGETQFDRIRARVEVAAVPTVAPEQIAEIRENATHHLDSNKCSKVDIVRRYREAPSPLARDSVRNWRTGRLEFVFDGNFDIIT